MLHLFITWWDYGKGLNFVGRCGVLSLDHRATWIFLVNVWLDPLDLLSQCLAGPLVSFKTIIAQLLKRECCVCERERERANMLFHMKIRWWTKKISIKRGLFPLLLPSILNKTMIKASSHRQESEHNKLHMPELPSHRQAWSGFGSCIIYKSWILVPVQELMK